MPFQTSNEKSEMVNKISLAVGVMASCSADLKGPNSMIDSHVDYFFVFWPTTHDEKGDGKSHDWIDGLKLPDNAKILGQNTGLVFILRSGSEGPSRDNVIGYAVAGAREVLCRATLTAYGGVVQIIPYRVVSPWGKPIGTLNVSFKFDDMVAAPSEEVAVAATCELSKGFDEVARDSFYALLQPQDSVYAPAGYALSPAVSDHALPPAVYADIAPPQPQQVNKKNNFPAKLRAMFTWVSTFAHLASAAAVMSADVDPGN